MAVTLGEVVEHARDAHPAFAPEAVPNASALRAVVRAYRALHARVAAQAREAIAETLEVRLPLQDFDAGVPLPEYVWIGAGDVRRGGQGGGASPFELVDPAMRDHRGFGGWTDGTVLQPVLRLLGRPADWEGVASVSVRLVAAVPERLAAADALQLPDGALEALAHAAAAMLCVTAGVPDARAAFARDAERAAADYLKTIAVRRLGRTAFVRDLA